jgi:signal transduction histidine kinase
MKHLIFVLLFTPLILNAQKPGLGSLSLSLERGSIILAKDWKYKAGDDPEWANPNFNDSSWQTFSGANLFNNKIQKKVKKTNIIWYRKRIRIDSTTTQNLLVYISQSGASEIYLDGELIHSLGEVSSNRDSIVRYNPANLPLAFPMKINKEQVLAVRFADSKKKFTLFQNITGILTIRVQKEISANDPLFVACDSLFDTNGILRLTSRNGWRYHPGDDLSWVDPDFDDSHWTFCIPSGFMDPIPDSVWNGCGWFRFRFVADSSVYAKFTHLYFFPFGAAEVYLDGKLVQKYGVFSTDPQTEKHYNPFYKTSPPVIVKRDGSHVLAVRFSNHKSEHYKKLFGKYLDTVAFGIGLATDYQNKLRISEVNRAWQLIYIFGTMLLLIILLHGFLYALFPTERSNLYIAIFASMLFLTILVFNIQLLYEPDFLQYILAVILFNFLVLTILAMIPFTINSMFNQRPYQKHKILIWLVPGFAMANYIISGPNLNIYITIIIASIVVIFSSQVLIQAIRNKQQGVWIVAGTFLGFVLSTVSFFIYATFSQNIWHDFGRYLTYTAYVSIPLGLTFFMAYRFRDLYTNLEQKVKERTLELNQSLEYLRSTQTQLIHSEKLASLGALTAGIAHEIQNPLNFVNNFSEISTELVDEMNEELNKGEIEEAKGISNNIKQNLKKISHHGKRADSIVKGMLLHSRGSSGHKEPTDINALCDEYLRLSYHGFRAKDKSFHAEYKTDLDPSLPKINVVPQDIGRVLLNLINNAFYAVNVRRNTIVKTTHALSQTSPPYNPTVTVTTKNFGNRIEIAVKDNGNGIPSDILEKIFQPFFTTKPTGQGTGLGLSLAYDMVKAHGGKLETESRPGEYTTFTVQLPVNAIDL